MYAYSQLDFCAIRDDLQKLAATVGLGQYHRQPVRRQYAVVLCLAVVRNIERLDGFE